MSPKISIVIPAKNEAHRLPQTLHRLRDYLYTKKVPAEVIVVNDQSQDRTAIVATELANPDFIVRVLDNPLNGVGMAVRCGMLAAKGERILMSDADGPVPFDHVDSLHDALDCGHDIAVGSRVGAGAHILQTQPPHRVVMGHVWRRLATAVVPVGIHDPQCGFKMFKSYVAKAVFSELQTGSFAFHVESLSLAKNLGFSVAEVPVEWSDVDGSKVKVLQDPFMMSLDLLKIRRRHAEFSSKAA